MVDVKRGVDEDGFEVITVTSDKTVTTFTIYKAENGFSQYLIKQSKGATPSKLRGVYTTPDSALVALKKHLATAKESLGVRREIVAARVEERKKSRGKPRNGKTVQPNSSDTVQQGTAD